MTASWPFIPFSVEFYDLYPPWEGVVEATARTSGLDYAVYARRNRRPIRPSSLDYVIYVRRNRRLVRPQRRLFPAGGPPDGARERPAARFQTPSRTSRTSDRTRLKCQSRRVQAFVMPFGPSWTFRRAFKSPSHAVRRRNRPKRPNNLRRLGRLSQTAFRRLRRLNFHRGTDCILQKTSFER